MATGPASLRLGVPSGGLVRTYDALTAPRPTRTTVLRRRLYALSVRLRWHPHWTRTAAVPAARAELRRQTRQLRALEGAR
jgi:hypothetical protein